MGRSGRCTEAPELRNVSISAYLSPPDFCLPAFERVKTQFGRKSRFSQMIKIRNESSTSASSTNLKVNRSRPLPSFPIFIRPPAINFSPFRNQSCYGSGDPEVHAVNLAVILSRFRYLRHVSRNEKLLLFPSFQSCLQLPVEPRN